MSASFYTTKPRKDLLENSQLVIYKREEGHVPEQTPLWSFELVNIPGCFFVFFLKEIKSIRMGRENPRLKINK